MPYTDAQLELKIKDLHWAIENWAKPKKLWYDCGFHTFFKHVDAEPSSPAVVTILWFEGPLQSVFHGTFDDGSIEEFDNLLGSLGFIYEHANSTNMHIYASDMALSEAFDNYFHWKWICSLIQPDCADVYEELYSHFAKKPEDLHKISWREFEILLFRIFQNQGFQALLGPGKGDGGVDIQLLQQDPLGDVLTLVQAKHYAPRNKIKLQAVQALYGATKAENATKGIFVTTSKYQPAAQKFASRVSEELELYSLNDVSKWCSTAMSGIIADKSKLISIPQLHRVIEGLNRSQDNRILHAHSGYGMITNEFALVLKETKYAALIMKLPQYTVSDADGGYGQMGLEAPILDERAFKMFSSEFVWRVKRKSYDSRIGYWDGSNLYFPWDGKPVYFDWRD